MVSCREVSFATTQILSDTGIVEAVPSQGHTKLQARLSGGRAWPARRRALITGGSAAYFSGVASGTLAVTAGTGSVLTFTVAMIRSSLSKISRWSIALVLSADSSTAIANS